MRFPPLVHLVPGLAEGQAWLKVIGKYFAKRATYTPFRREFACVSKI